MRNYLLEIEIWAPKQTVWLNVYVESENSAYDLGYSYVKVISNSPSDDQGFVTVHDKSPW